MSYTSQLQRYVTSKHHFFWKKKSFVLHLCKVAEVFTKEEENSLWYGVFFILSPIHTFIIVMSALKHKRPRAARLYVNYIPIIGIISNT